MAAAKAAGATRVVAQSIAFAYAKGEGVRVEDDPLAPVSADEPLSSVAGVVGLERPVLQTPGIEGIVLRYGYLYGPRTWNGETPPKPPAVHVDAAAQAALLAVTRGKPGIYNIAEDGPAVSSEKAKRELGFDARFRLA
jgi:nucleoside-diphosphate-sugar epimerase